MAEALDIRPREGEVGAAYLPPGASLSWDGNPVQVPESETAWFAEIGWSKVSDGADLVWNRTADTIRRKRARRSRRAWNEAARILRRAAREGSGPAVVYVAIESRREYGRPVLAAVRVRRENDD